MNGIVFLVDCADQQRLLESKVELDVSFYTRSSYLLLYLFRMWFEYLNTPQCLSHAQALLSDETISNVPVLVLGNKIDRPEAVSEDSLRGIFNLNGQTTGKVRI